MFFESASCYRVGPDFCDLEWLNTLSARRLPGSCWMRVSSEERYEEQNIGLPGYGDRSCMDRKPEIGFSKGSPGVLNTVLNPIVSCS